MSVEVLKEQLEKVIHSGDPLVIRELLDDQNISDVADLIYEVPEYESQIVTAMSVHRAAGVFKILEFPTQKRIIQTLQPGKTAELLNELPPDDRTDFLEELPSNVVRELIKLLDGEESRSSLLKA